MMLIEISAVVGMGWMLALWVYISPRMATRKAQQRCR